MILRTEEFVANSVGHYLDGTPYLAVDVPPGMISVTPDRRLALQIRNTEADLQARLDLYYASKPYGCKYKVVSGKYAGWVAYAEFEPEVL
jgi:hypothetical protein